MNREDIIRMAREAGDADRIDPFTKDGDWVILTPDELERFAALVASHALVEPCCGNYDQCQKVCMPRAASAEREACAKVVETLWDTPTNGMATEEQFYGNECAKVIRARGQA